MQEHKNGVKVLGKSGKKWETLRATQIETVFQYLLRHTATAAMVSEATGIPHKNVTRHKAALCKDGRLWQVKRAMCKLTKYPAWYLTTNPSPLALKKAKTNFNNGNR